MVAQRFKCSREIKCRANYIFTLKCISALLRLLYERCTGEWSCLQNQTKWRELPRWNHEESCRQSLELQKEHHALVCGKKSKQYFQAKKITVVASVANPVLIPRKKRTQSQSMFSTKQRKKLTVQPHNLLSTLKTEIGWEQIMSLTQGYLSRHAISKMESLVMYYWFLLDKFLWITVFCCYVFKE